MSRTVEAYRGDPAVWDAFVASRPEATFCHRHAWRRVIETAFGHECLWLVATEAGRIEGVLPLVRVRSRLFGHYLVSLPFLNYGGPLGEPAAVGALAAHAAELAAGSRARLLELRSRVELPIDLVVSHRKITVVLDLPDSSELLMKTFSSKLRSQIRRPFKEGVTVRVGADQLDPFYAVFSRHMRDLGTPVMPRRFFAAALERFGDEAWFGCAWHGGRPVACGAGFVHGGEFEMTWASALSAFNRIAPNMGLYFGFMERAVERGLTRFNFGRCTPGGGTHRFKSQWGAKDEPLWWYQWTPGDRAATTPAPDGGALAWGPRLWKRLPLPVANWLGPKIVKSIP